MNEKENIHEKKQDASRFPTFRRIGNALHLRRRKAPEGFELEKDAYKPGLNYRMLGKNWKGPIYFMARNHRLDLQYIISQIRSLVRTNVPLVPGIGAVAREEQRTGPGNALIKALWITGYFLVGMLLFYFMLVETRFPGMIPLLMSLVFFVLMTYEIVQGRRVFALIHLAAMIICIAAFFTIAFILDWRHVFPWSRYYEPQDLLIFGIVAITVACFVITFRRVRRNGPREMVLARLQELLNNGLDLSAAMRRLPRFFPQFYADMVEAGEQTGRMDDCLAELCEDVGTDLKVQRQIRGTILYLGIVGFVLITIMTFLMIKVVPVFLEIHSEFGYTAHVPFVSTLINIGDMLIAPVTQPQQVLYDMWNVYPSTQAKIALVKIIIAAAVLFVPVYFVIRILRKRRRSFSSRSLSSLFLLLPGFRSMVMQDNFTVITGTLEKLLCAGVPLDRAVEKASAGDVNPAYRRMLRRVHKRILEGESLVAAFQQASSGLLVPASFTSFVSVGEQSGMLPEALAYLHTFYRAQANIRARILVDTIKPFGVMAMGLIVMLFMRDMFTMLVGITESILISM